MVSHQCPCVNIFAKMGILFNRSFFSFAPSAIDLSQDLCYNLFTFIFKKCHPILHYFGWETWWKIPLCAFTVFQQKEEPIYE